MSKLELDNGRKNDPEKDRKALVTYVELKGNAHGGNRKSRCQNGTLNLDEIAKELNISKRNLQRALRIERNLTPNMQPLFSHAQLYTMFSRVKSYVGYAFICYNVLI